jgi:hypothetical protein
LGRLRYVVEQTFAQFRWERQLDIHDDFVRLACVLICWRRLINRTRQKIVLGIFNHINHEASLRFHLPDI